MTTHIFKNKQELAEALMRGEKWRPRGVDRWCYYDDITFNNPFRIGNINMNGIWSNADGATVWEKLEKSKPKKTVYEWRYEVMPGRWLISEVLLTEKEAQEHFGHHIPYKKTGREFEEK